MYKILITGVQGFIGSSLAKSLSGVEDYQLYGIDIVEDHLCLSDLEYTIVDIRDDRAVSAYLAEHQFDLVVHLAAISRVVEAEKDKHGCVDTNYHGTQYIVDILSQTQTKIIFASSREVYGEQIVFPVSEDAELLPLNIYGFYKYMAEQYIRSMMNNYVILRFCNVYGSQYDIPGRVIPTFVHNALSNQELVIEGGRQFIDFTYIDDTVWAVERAIQLLLSGTLNQETITISPGEGHTLQELVAIIERVVGKTQVVKINSERDYDVQHFVASPAKRKLLLGEREFVTLQDGVRQYINLLVKMQKA